MKMYMNDIDLVNILRLNPIFAQDYEISVFGDAE